MPELSRRELPPAMARALGQTLAAERLEGWWPTEENVADLALLLAEAMTFREYLAKYRDRHLVASPMWARRPVFARRQPYLIPGTSLLRNNFGARSAECLQTLEYLVSAARIAQLHRRIATNAVTAGDLDVSVIHHHVFADVYAWAGRARITELRRGDVVFASCSSLTDALARVAELARSLTAGGHDVDDGALAYGMARLYADYNHAHPFREGNGRAGTSLLHCVAHLCGRQLDLGAFSRAEWVEASRDCMPFRRNGTANHRPFLPLFKRALRTRGPDQP